MSWNGVRLRIETIIQRSELAHSAEAILPFAQQDEPAASHPGRRRCLPYTRPLDDTLQFGRFRRDPCEAPGGISGGALDYFAEVERRMPPMGLGLGGK